MIEDPEMVQKEIMTPSALEVLLVGLIAAEAKISPDQVTPDYIHEQRTEKLYPKTRYNIGSAAYGGYDADSLVFMDNTDFEEIDNDVDRQMKQL